ncbi:anthranilate synthase component I family protein [Dactylosporangium fulvum]|uniref:Anthranilate synthase component I family protein n=1 Tax=Dactylosporangium fulvum TaxID=53359 RepID=A0ABY5W7W1_9ACTN|nr:anthranilate synthase component I family protein [Dactylosporangium fulvum]UWP86168.1 anthranilate synthase component I family protein [Dactylosporangium fulvum]
MSTLGPVVGCRLGSLDLHPPGVPPACRTHIWERSRLEWHSRDGGDPLRLLSEFLSSHGVPVDDLSSSPRVIDSSVCGAAVLLSPPSVKASPAAAVPALVAVVYAHGPQRAPDADEPARPALGPWTGSWTAARHARAVDEVRAAIARGDVYVVNLVGHASAPFGGDPRAALARVAALPGARYGGVLHGDGWWVASASPETLVEVSGGRAVTRPIKGTRPATAEGRAELLASAKERAEHVMIVDLERNDLGRVARVGSVRVDELFAIRRWSGLWQAESTVSARLAGGVGLAELLRAVWPGGSVTGAPKLAAIDVAARLEPVGRGPSMGAFGWVGHGPGGALTVDLGLTIRTVAIAGGRAHVWAGGGIVWDSDPQAEVAEAAAKSAPVKTALSGDRGAA